MSITEVNSPLSCFIPNRVHRELKITIPYERFVKVSDYGDKGRLTRLAGIEQLHEPVQADARVEHLSPLQILSHQDAALGIGRRVARMDAYARESRYAHQQREPCIET